MAITAQSIIDQAKGDYRDPTNVDIADADWLKYLNDAQRAVCNFKPDAKSEKREIDLVTGTIQTIGTGGRRLMALYNNLYLINTSIKKPGKAITKEDKGTIDSYSDDWHDPVNYANAIRNYAYNPNDPTSFFVYPGIPEAHSVPNSTVPRNTYPRHAIASSGGTSYINNGNTTLTAAPPGTGWTEINAVSIKALGDVAINPTDAAIGDNIDIPDIYEPMILEWMMYRAWIRDSDRSPNYGRGVQRLNTFFNLLGIKRDADMSISPNMVERETAE